MIYSFMCKPISGQDKWQQDGNPAPALPVSFLLELFKKVKFLTARVKFMPLILKNIKKSLTEKTADEIPENIPPATGCIAKRFCNIYGLQPRATGHGRIQAEKVAALRTRHHISSAYTR